MRRLYPANIAKRTLLRGISDTSKIIGEDVPAGCSTKDGIVRFNLANGGSDLSFVKML